MDVLAILAIGLLGGAIPLLVKWSERGLHTALALSTGIFLGAVFLHLLPEVAATQLWEVVDPHVEECDDPTHNHNHAGHNHGSIWIWLFVLVGVLGVYFVESLVLRTHDHDELHRHRSVGYAALLGISVHALTAGIAYGATVSTPMFLAILAHKGFEAFSLTTVFQLAEFSRKRLYALVIAFAAVTPAGILLGGSLKSWLGQGTDGRAILTALAAGTFLYVCLCELLTEVFHHKEDGLKKVGLLVAGIAMAVVFEGIGHG